MVQILEIMTEKEPLKTLKNIAKKYQKKLSTVFGGFQGLNDLSNQISETTFHRAVIP